MQAGALARQDCGCRLSNLILRCHTELFARAIPPYEYVDDASRYTQECRLIAHVCLIGKLALSERVATKHQCLANG